VTSAIVPITIADDAENYSAIESAKLTLSQAIDAAATDLEGKPIEAEFEVESGEPVFRVRLIQKDGRVVRVTIDSRTGGVMRISPHSAAERLEEKLESFFHRRPLSPKAPKLNLRDAVIIVEKAVIGKTVEAEVEKDKADIFWYEVKVLNENELLLIRVDPETGRL
jgi:uncharacterized membrane protein YkoI